MTRKSKTAGNGYRRLLRIHGREELLSMGITPEHPDNPVFKSRDTSELLNRYSGIHLTGFEPGLREHVRVRAAHIMHWHDLPAETAVHILFVDGPGHFGLGNQTRFDRRSRPPTVRVAANEDSYTMMRSFCVAMAAFAQNIDGSYEAREHGVRWRGEFHSIVDTARKPFEAGYAPWDAAAGLLGFKLENAFRKMLGQPPVKDRLLALIYCDPTHPDIQALNIKAGLPAPARAELAELEAEMAGIFADLDAAQAEVDAATVELRLCDAVGAGRELTCADCGGAVPALYGYDPDNAQCSVCFNADAAWHLRHENLRLDCAGCDGMARVNLMLAPSDFDRVYPQGVKSEQAYCPACLLPMLREEVGGITAILAEGVDRNKLRVFVP